MNTSGPAWLYIDLNAFYASVEQELRPKLRDRPIAIIPVEARSACCIAVSYEAKASGVQSGMSAAEARARCPALVLIKVRPRIYVEFYQRIRAAIERCVPISQVLSCDEFACHLMGRERETEHAIALAHSIKNAVSKVGAMLRCSIGLAPNRLLAKMAAGMQKPDGLTLLDRAALPHALYSCELRDVPGIGTRMERRLRAARVVDMRQLCALSRQRMHGLWGGVLGDRLWLALRGEDLPEPAPRAPQSFSRQHILPPDCRNLQRARAIAAKLLHTVARRMREKDLWAESLWLQVGFAGCAHALEAVMRFAATQSPAVLQQYLAELWKEVPARWSPSDLTVALCNLSAAPQPDLFPVPSGRHEQLTAAVDGINRRFGADTVYLGSIHSALQDAPACISFGPPPELSEF